MILEKYQGCGNDFLIADGSRTPVIDPQQVAALCDRHRGFGADGLIIEVHACPECAWSDGAQSLKPAKFASLIEKGRAIAQVVGRSL